MMRPQLSQDIIAIFDVISAILLRCFIITFLALLFVWILIVFQGNFFYQVQTLFVDVSRPDFDLFILYALTLLKILNVVFFLFPFLAIKLFLRSQK